MLAKPFEPQLVIGRVRELLAKSLARRVRRRASPRTEPTQAAAGRSAGRRARAAPAPLRRGSTTAFDRSTRVRIDAGAVARTEPPAPTRLDARVAGAAGDARRRASSTRRRQRPSSPAALPTLEPRRRRPAPSRARSRSPGTSRARRRRRPTSRLPVRAHRAAVAAAIAVPAPPVRSCLARRRIRGAARRRAGEPRPPMRRPRRSLPRRRTTR